ncbi:MAG: Sjogren's syndrome/scleroderma autoantigen 1 family protein [Nitrososphaera sp.]|jgi:uncharacterized Zn finger protein (UPF0148 family)
MSGSESASRIKSAASALLKGGTLVSEQCEKCGGVQVKLANKVTCINCGNESQAGAAKEDKPNNQQQQYQQHSADMDSAAAAIEAKISAIAREIQSEQDTTVQKQKAELLESYLRILEKMRSLSRQ